MATNTAVFSGPGGFRSQVVAALSDAGFAVSDDEQPHGLPDTVAGEKDPTVGWASVTGDDVDIDAAAAVVSSLKWVLRAHYPMPHITAPLIADQRAAHEELVRRIVREELAKGGVA